jgi:uncharacterized protein YjiS (DUF1127 family)
MNTFVLGAPRAVAAPVRTLSRCASWLLTYFARREAVKLLSQLDERELRDIGLTRGRIEAAVNGYARAESELGRVR